jgi:hypothetical protein
MRNIRRSNVQESVYTEITTCVGCGDPLLVPFV